MVSASNPSGAESSRGARVSVRAPGGGKIKKLLSMGGTFLTVAVLTVLLWVWADQSQLVSQEIKLSFVLATEDQSGLILLSENDGSVEAEPDPATGGQRIKAEVRFKGTRSLLRELQVDLHSGRLKLRAYISADSYWAKADKISVIDLLDGNTELRERGVTVVKAEPENISVTLDKWVPIKIKLALKDTSGSQRFAATIEPAEIAVDVPSSLMDSLPEELLVELGEIPDKISSGEILTGTVSRELGGLPVKPALSEVAVILEPRKQDTIPLGQLQIRVSVPANMFGDYKLVWADSARKVVDVFVEGPTAELDKLRIAPQEKVRAYIDLDLQHTRPTVTFYQVIVRFEFEDDVRGVKISGSDKHTVKVRLEKRPTAP